MTSPVPSGAYYVAITNEALSAAAFFANQCEIFERDGIVRLSRKDLLEKVDGILDTPRSSQQYRKLVAGTYMARGPGDRLSESRFGAG